jgi:hypothetical protein
VVGALTEETDGPDCNKIYQNPNQEPIMAQEGGLGIPLMLLNALDTYNGTTEPKEWLRTFEKVAIAAEWTPSKRMRMAHPFLRGEADKWLEAEPNSNTWTWEDFVANFTKRFTRSGGASAIQRMFETWMATKGREGTLISV